MARRPEASKGEKGSRVVYANSFTKTGTDDKGAEDISEGALINMLDAARVSTAAIRARLLGGTILQSEGNSGSSGA